MKNIVLITGGARSGKSLYALALAKEFDRKTFIATAQAFDKEMVARIAKHKQDRDASFSLIEEPLDLSGALKSASQVSDVIIVDCLTLWVSNLLHNQNSMYTNETRIESLVQSLKGSYCKIIIVTNEVGMGIIPDNELSRQYRDLLGMINHRIAMIADQVVLMVCGIPVIIKK